MSFISPPQTIAVCFSVVCFLIFCLSLPIIVISVIIIVVRIVTDDVSHAFCNMLSILCMSDMLFA